MQIIDKTLNRVIKWESEDVSIPEMVELIESEIIAKSSGNDLVRLKKGMYKTWVLATGQAANLRYYPSFGAPIHLCLEFNLLTHNIQQITLQDTTNKVEYFIPRGKESCKKLQRAVLRRLEQYTGDEVETKRRPGQRGKFQSQKPSPSPLKWLGIGSLGIAAVAVVLMIALKLPSIGGWLGGSFSDTPEWVSTVQNGYLGEYTDITVYELLSTYRSFYENEVWDGGTTDAGTKIAEVRFTSPQSDDSTTIQFQMLNEEVFKVSAFVDTTQPNAQNSDILYMLNLMYYSEASMKYLLEEVKTEQLCTLLRTVDANEVYYGAAAGYTGDRSALYKLNGDSLMGLSAADLMEYYGTRLLDTPAQDNWSIALPPEEPTEITSPQAEDDDLVYCTADEMLDDLNNDVTRAKVKYMGCTIELIGLLDGFSDDGKTFTLRNVLLDYSQKVTCSVPKNIQASALALASYGDYVTIRGQVTQAEQSVGYTVQTFDIVEIAENPDNRQETAAPETLTGTVKRSSGELRVRCGPGTDYSEIRRLNAGAVVTIYEQQNVNGTYWGNIGDGWICMDYVDLGPHQSQPAGSSSTSVNMTVCVKLTAGELRIRSGPDTSYSEVGRLYGGEILTVTELQQTGSTQWGRIPQGWICMDYVDTVYGTQNERSNAQRFVGNWQDQNSQRCCLTIEPGEYGIFVIDISWGNSAFSTSMWRAVGEYDANSDCIRYHDCDHWESVSDGNGNFTNNYYYTGGQGIFYFSSGNLLWQEYNESTGSQCSFVKFS